jgi:hypothetical protein
VDNFTEQSYFRFDSRAEQQYEVYLRYGQHPELYPNRRGEVSERRLSIILPGSRIRTVLRRLEIKWNDTSSDIWDISLIKHPREQLYPYIWIIKVTLSFSVK